MVCSAQFPFGGGAVSGAVRELQCARSTPTTCCPVPAVSHGASAARSAPCGRYCVCVTGVCAAECPEDRSPSAEWREAVGLEPKGSGTLAAEHTERESVCLHHNNHLHTSPSCYTMSSSSSKHTLYTSEGCCQSDHVTELSQNHNRPRALLIFVFASRVVIYTLQILEQ